MAIRNLTAEPVLEAAAFLGEGPLWDPDLGVLWWVDILVGDIHRFDPNDRSDRVIATGEAVGALGLRSSGGLVASSQSGLMAIDPTVGRTELLVPVGPERPPRRPNDGKVDPTGAFWAGRMGLGAEPGIAALLRFDPDRSVTAVLDGLTIPNGMAWSGDSRVMYFVDSATRTIAAHDYDPTTRSIGQGRVLAEFPAGLGLPDGLTIDSEDCLWVAVWGSGSVLRVAADGTVLAQVRVPGVSRVSSCAFGGRDLGDLYITTAREGMSPSEAVLEPLAGSLFRARPGVPGRAPDRYGG